ncbi:MAG TPA: hypothetical protein VHL52_01400 [Acidimicrobiia bacterium]|nr:hypothetical protein [Acidimicrobiia bacterium]
MTRQRSFKRLVRERMAKTGESYTTARAVILAASQPSDSEEPALVTSDETIRARTGRGWEDWFDRLDSWSATELSHREIARKVAAELGIDPLAWNAQAITTSYERARGGREVGERADGYAATASKTVAVPVDELYDAFTGAERRVEWLTEDRLRPRSGTRPRTARFDWDDDGTRVHVSFGPKSETKSVVSVEHLRLPDAAAAEEMKQLWRSGLDRLRSHLEGTS